MLFSRKAACSVGSFHRSRGSRFLSSGEIRSCFLEYFEAREHQLVDSSGLVPENDQTLLFTNAGMVQFKERFLGQPGKYSDVSRACSVQRCMRAGGKHNDLSNVGFTPRHHTFFEMLGNFSFGDYFKEEAIFYAWDFVTKELKLPQSKLRVTVHKDDGESARLWSKIAPEVNPILLGDDDNFWSMGEGEGVPCGPCTEIFYDLGDHIGDQDSRWLEIWNLVFMEYRVDANQQLQRLPDPCVDTGMGLERIASVLQGVHSNYETDLFLPLLSHINHLPRDKPLPSNSDHCRFAQNLIADHIRAIAFLIADGVVPSNVGRGHVLRRLVRRSIVFGRKLGVKDHFMAGLLPVLGNSLGLQYPQLLERHEVVSNIIQQEERLFYRTLDNGMALLEKHLQDKSLDADSVFRLNDSYGFPLDLAVDIAADQGIEVDMQKVEKLLESHRNRSGSGTAWKQSLKLSGLDGEDSCQFIGYESLESNGCRVKSVQSTEAGNAWVVLDPCPFYGEGGGQEGDRGTLLLEEKNCESVQVVNSIKTKGGNVALLVESSEKAVVELLSVGDRVDARVDREFRELCSVHHSATHLLHAALQQHLGKEVLQAGSLVTSTRLRFDFTYPRALSSDEIQQLEDDVNSKALAAHEVTDSQMSLSAAKQIGAAMLFSENYGEQVRVVSIGKGSDAVSLELCGGTHVSSTRFLFPFKIVSETSAAAGTRRIQAVAGQAALEWLNSQKQLLDTTCLELNASPGDLLIQVGKLKEKLKAAAQENDRLSRSFGANSPTKLLGSRYCVHMVPTSTSKDKKKATKQLQEIATSASIEEPEKLHIVISGRRILCTASELSTCEYTGNAADCLKRVLAVLGGKGGGNKNLAHGELDSQANNISALREKLTSIFG